MSNALAVTGSTELAPEEILGKQAKIINALRFLINKKTVIFKDPKTNKESKHIEAMAWQSIASMFGLMPKILVCEEDENGMRAVAQLVKWSTSEIVGEMPAYVGKDEKQWYGGKGTRRDGSEYDLPKKPFNQIRSMAQTRAIRQVIKVALGHVAILLENNFGIDTTKSAEEARTSQMEEEQEQLPPPVTKIQWDTIKEKKELAGVSSDELIKRFGPSDKLNEESARAVIAHLDGVIASQEGAKEG